MFVSETYELEDCIKYYSTDRSSDSTVNLTLPNDYIITWNTSRTGTGGSFIRIGNNNNNALAIGTIGSNGMSGLWENVNGNWAYQYDNGTISNGNHTYEITMSNGTVTFKLDSTTTSSSSISVNINNFLGYYVNSANKMKNFKIKPL